MKIIIILATRCQILRLKRIKFEFGWGFTPHPAGGAYRAPPHSLADGEGLAAPPQEITHALGISGLDDILVFNVPPFGTRVCARNFIC